jgi:hypothetical protein
MHERPPFKSASDGSRLGGQLNYWVVMHQPKERIAFMQLLGWAGPGRYEIKSGPMRACIIYLGQKIKCKANRESKTPCWSLLESLCLKWQPPAPHPPKNNRKLS